MLGCQDFCGYYDWTFHYLRKRFGQDAVQRLWAEAIGLDSQLHYLDAARRDGLRGLLRTWTKTGEDEHCDWTFTLDESRNVLRWDMRRCPSKGFLLENDLHADEDYCDHCMGWVIPLLDQAGIEVAGHEHNHCGQCWGEFRVKGKPYQSIAGHAADVTRDARWKKGHLDRWKHGIRQPVVGEIGPESDLVELIRAWTSRCHAGKTDRRLQLLSNESYVSTTGVDPDAVLIADQINDDQLEHLGRRYRAAPPNAQPLLLYTYFPRPMDAPHPCFAAFGLRRPVPILPLLIRMGLYHHRPGAYRPTTQEILEMVCIALQQMLKSR